MGRHEDDLHPPTGNDGPDRRRPRIRLGNTGRHSDNDLDRRGRPRGRLIFLWSMIVLAIVTLIMVTGSMIDSTRDIGGTGLDDWTTPDDQVVDIVTETVEVPGPTVTRRVPGPRITVVRTIYPTPSATPSPVPGPTVTRRVPGPTVYRQTPGPTVTETITRCYSWDAAEIDCP